MARFHLLSQYVWPDGAPTAIYAEQLGEYLQAAGEDVVLAGGTGAYREANRPKPRIAMQPLGHFKGQRGRLGSVAREYLSVERAFASYVEGHARPGDVVVVTSAPPNSVRLARAIERRSASAVYWLQDYYPELVRGVFDPPATARRLLTRWFDGHLRRWTRVVKIGANLGYDGPNAVVIRNWPTVRFPLDGAAVPRTALYSGNLGYGHSVPALLEACGRLRDEGYTITVRGDGPGMALLPGWIRVERPVRDTEDLVRSYLAAEVHLIAAHPRIQRAVFPSKLWNSLASGRRILYSGFEGAMHDELKASIASDHARHLEQWGTLLRSLA